MLFDTTAPTGVSRDSSDPTRKLIIAIDGPSGAGKGTIARTIARLLGYRHVDTGAMYRAVGWKAIQDGLALDDDAAITTVAEQADIQLDDRDVTIDGHVVTTAIRTPEIDRAATSVARLAGVRRVLVARQQEMGAKGGVVMEGRDIGTVVFPGADVKIYLDASAEERARRRVNDSAHASGAAGQAAVADAIAARDRSDSTRAVSPLMAAPDAVVIDTTGMSIDEVVTKVMQIVSAGRP